MLKRVGLALCVAGGCGLAHAATPPAAGLSAFYDRALAHDAEFQAAVHQRDAARYAYPLARAAVLPQLETSFSYAYSDTEVDIAGQPTRKQSGVNRSLDLTLSQAVFNWAAFKQLSLAERQVALAEAQFAIAEEALILRVAEAYFGVLAAADTLRSVEAEHEAVGRQLELAQERFEVGLSAITDVQEAQARFDLTLAERINAERLLDAARQALLEITGEAALQPAGVPAQVNLPTPEPATPEPWVAQAREANRSVLASAIGVSLAESGLEVARAGRLPTVNARAQISDGRNETGVFPADVLTQSVGVQVTLPLFSGLATTSRIGEAGSVLDQRRAELTQVQRQVERLTRDTFQAVVAGLARVRALNQAVLSSRTALEASETGLEVGTRTAVDVLNAQQQLFLAERNAFQARYDYLLALLGLKRAAGQLGRADLEWIDALIGQR